MTFEIKYEKFEDMLDGAFIDYATRPLQSGNLKVLHERFFGYISNPGMVELLQKYLYERGDRGYLMKISEASYIAPEGNEWHGKPYYAKVYIKPKNWFKSYLKDEIKGWYF